MPWVTYTDPEVAQVGENEISCQQKGIAFEVTRYGVDGIASITAIVAFAALGFFAFSKSANQDWQFFCFLIIFTIGGFLPWNFFLPKVFMGDVGSIFLGTTIACSIVFLSQNWFDFF